MLTQLIRPLLHAARRACLPCLLFFLACWVCGCEHMKNGIYRHVQRRARQLLILFVLVVEPAPWLPCVPDPRPCCSAAPSELSCSCKERQLGHTRVASFGVGRMQGNGPEVQVVERPNIWPDSVSQSWSFDDTRCSHHRNSIADYNSHQGRHDRANEHDHNLWNGYGSGQFGL